MTARPVEPAHEMGIYKRCFTRVTSVNRYATFEEMFDHQDVASVNPLATRAEQLANIRQIYPPEREALGVVAIGIELVDPPDRTPQARHCGPPPPPSRF